MLYILFKCFFYLSLNSFISLTSNVYHNTLVIYNSEGIASKKCDVFFYFVNLNKKDV